MLKETGYAVECAISKSNVEGNVLLGPIGGGNGSVMPVARRGLPRVVRPLLQKHAELLYFHVRSQEIVMVFW